MCEQLRSPAPQHKALVCMPIADMVFLLGLAGCLTADDIEASCTLIPHNSSVRHLLAGAHLQLQMR